MMEEISVCSSKTEHRLSKADTGVQQLPDFTPDAFEHIITECWQQISKRQQRWMAGSTRNAAFMAVVADMALQVIQTAAEEILLYVIPHLCASVTKYNMTTTETQIMSDFGLQESRICRCLGDSVLQAMADVVDFKGAISPSFHTLNCLFASVIHRRVSYVLCLTNRGLRTDSRVPLVFVTLGRIYSPTLQHIVDHIAAILNTWLAESDCPDAALSSFNNASFGKLSRHCHKNRCKERLRCFLKSYLVQRVGTLRTGASMPQSSDLMSFGRRNRVCFLIGFQARVVSAEACGRPQRAQLSHTLTKDEIGAIHNLVDLMMEEILRPEDEDDSESEADICLESELQQQLQRAEFDDQFSSLKEDFTNRLFVLVMSGAKCEMPVVPMFTCATVSFVEWKHSVTEEMLLRYSLYLRSKDLVERCVNQISLWFTQDLERSILWPHSYDGVPCEDIFKDPSPPKWEEKQEEKPQKKKWNFFHKLKNLYANKKTNI